MHPASNPKGHNPMPRRPENPVRTHGRNLAEIHARLLALDRRIAAVLRPRPVLRSETRLVASWLSEVTRDVELMTIAFSDEERQVQALAMELQRRLSARAAAIADCLWPNPATVEGALPALAHQHALTTTIWRATMPVFRRAMLPQIQDRLAATSDELQRLKLTSPLRRPALEAAIEAWRVELPGLARGNLADEQRRKAWLRLSERLLRRPTPLVWGPSHCDRMLLLAQGLSASGAEETRLMEYRAEWERLGSESAILRREATPELLVEATQRELALLLALMRRETRALELAPSVVEQQQAAGDERMVRRARQMTWALRLLASEETLLRLVQAQIPVVSGVWTQLARAEWWLHRHTAIERSTESRLGVDAE